MGEKRVILEHQPKISLVRWNSQHTDAIPQNVPALSILEPGDDAQQGTLAAAGTPQQAEDLSTAVPQMTPH